MKNFISDKVKHYRKFADVIDKKFMQIRYGVKSCSAEQDLYLAEIRKDLVNWQLNNDNGALTEVGIQYSTSMNITYDDNTDTDNLLFSHSGGTGGISGPGCYVKPSSLKINYDSSYGVGNIIDVNTAGCVTRINLNPNINIEGAGTFVYTQVIASTTWNIVHNLGYIPNIFTVDNSGNTIEGIITPVNINTIQITFSSAVAGIAYLS